MSKEIKQIQKMKDFTSSYREGLRRELQIALDWHNSIKYNFIKGQLDILSKVDGILNNDRENDNLY